MIKEIFNAIGTQKRAITINGVHGAAKAYLAVRMFKEVSHSLVVVLPTQKEALRLLEDLGFFMADEDVSLIYFPGYNILPFKSLAYHSKTAAQRISGLYRLISESRRHIVVTCIDTLLQKVMPRSVLVGSADLVINGDEMDRDLLLSRLNGSGYIRTTLVEEPGDYAVRGGILDVFSPGSSEPVRIEQFGDYVESLRYFSPVTQRGIEEIEEAIILPASEAVVEKSALPHIINRLRQAGGETGVNLSKIRDCVDKIREFGRFPGMESMLSIVYSSLDSFFNYVPEDAVFLLDQPMEISARAREFEKQAEENYTRARAENRLCVDKESVYLKYSDALQTEFMKQAVCLNSLAVSAPDSDAPPISFIAGFENNQVLCSELVRRGQHEHLLKPLADWFMRHEASGFAAVAVCSSDTQLKRLLPLLQPYGIALRYLKRLDLNTHPGPGMFYTTGNLATGFVCPEIRLALVTDQEIFGAKKQRRRQASKRAKSTFITLEEMKQGDVVVHVEHGLGRYDGLVTLTIQGFTADFIQLTYKDDDRLFLPVDRMEMIEKYMGVDGYQPLLDKIGGKTWSKSKAKAKKEVEKMAGELLKLYAERRVVEGYAFSPADTFFNDFEASFPYDETPDQLQAINDVLEDMEQETPMDRLVCGDVGYGKTEVAVRATFKAVNDGKQVAIIVPTTILAEQHLQTFRNRFSAYPVTIEALSRFRSRKEQTAIVKRVAEGKTDVIIGTHRLLQKDISFKSLGLLVIDEEQRFGVKHKEVLKKRRSTVDVLALTATPIPRTLHMSLTGMRDISVISTPPADRQAIVSYVSEYDDSIAAEAIRKELARKGQIFFIHNTIETIDKTASHIKKLVPEVRLGVAHGRLSESELEAVMFKFINAEIDMLVCTTIVESGLDIPSANTMIIDRADRFGLSQIYQLRGRIGRGEEQAYAYLFIPEENRLSKDATKRLAALMEHRDLGSGFQIAMKDLQIRGSGSALGASQSGHIAAVGYDMFLKLLDEAVADLKGKPVVEPLEPEINMSLSAYISEDYVQSIEQRLTLYRRLSQLTELSEISAMQQELADRFGKIPAETGNMLLKIMLRILAIKAGVKKLDISNDSVTLVFSELHQKTPFALAGTLPALVPNAEFTAENTLRVTFGSKRKTISKALGETKALLTEISSMVNR